MAIDVQRREQKGPDQRRWYYFSMSSERSVDLNILNSTTAEMEWDRGRGLASLEAEPAHLEVDRGKRFADVLWTGFYPLISKNVVDRLMFHGLTGWKACPAVFKGKLLPPEQYFVLSITGRCRSISVSDRTSPLTFTRVVRSGAIGIYGRLIVDCDDEVREDFVMAADGKTGFRCVSQRVVDVFARYKFTGSVFEPIEEVQIFQGTVPPAS